MERRPADARRLSRRTLVQGAGAATLALTGALPLAVPAVRAQSARKLTFWTISSFTPDSKAPIYQAISKYKDATGVEVTIESTHSASRRSSLAAAKAGSTSPGSA